MRVRRATPEDADAIAATHVASWRSAYRGLMPDAYLDALSAADDAVRWRVSLGHEDLRGKRTVVSVDSDDAVVGYATVGPDEDPAQGMLLLMYVLEDAWGSGVGRALMDASTQALRELGYREAVLWVLERNDRARRFYEAAGWIADGARQTNDYGGVELGALRYRIAL